MDFIGWFGVGVLLALMAGLSAWRTLGDRGRAERIRAFAAANGLMEMALASRPTWVPAEVRVFRTMPSFTTSVGGRAILVLPLKTRIRFGYVWAICASTPGAAPVLVLSRLIATSWHVVGGRPKTMVEGTPADSKFAGKFYAYHPPGTPLEAALPPDAIPVMVDGSAYVVAWMVRTDGVAVLMVREFYGRPPSAWLAPALAAIDRLVSASSARGKS